jgi:hypothetical protein
LRIGGWLGGGDEVQRFDPLLPVIDLVDAVAFGVDRSDAFLRRHAEGGIRITRGWSGVSIGTRIDHDRALRMWGLWSLFGRRQGGAPFRPIDPGETRMLTLELALRGGRIAPWLALRLAGEMGRTAPPSSSFVGTRDLRLRLTARPILPGGKRLVVRCAALAGDEDLPLQDRLCLGGGLTIRGYEKGALTGRNGYHVGGELFLNRDLVGWLPWIPDRGLGLEAFLAGDHGRILDDRRARGGERAGASTSAGVGFAWTVGLPGVQRVLVGLHRGLARRDHEWRLRMSTESVGLEDTNEDR